MIKYYTSINDLYLHNWNQYSKTKDNKWFIIGYDPNEKYEGIDNEYLKLLEEQLIDEYFVEIDDRKFRNKLIKLAQIEHLKLKYNYLWAVLERMWLGFTPSQSETRIEFIKLLERFGYQMGYINTPEQEYEELLRISTELDGIKNKINLLIDEVKIEHGDIEDGPSSVHRQLIQTSRILELGYRIDPKEITVAEWLQYIKLVDEKIKEHKQKDNAK